MFLFKALFEIIVNSELNLKAYYQKQEDYLWQKINQRELLGVKINGFKFMLEILDSVFIKARVKPKNTTFINCNLSEYSNERGRILIPKVANRGKVESLDEIGVGLGNLGEVKINEFEDYKKVDFKGKKIFNFYYRKVDEKMKEERVNKEEGDKENIEEKERMEIEKKNEFEIKLKREIETCCICYSKLLILLLFF